MSSNISTNSKRSAGFVLMDFGGKSGSLAGTHIFPALEAPFCHKGFQVSFGLCTFADMLSQFSVFHLWLWSKKLESEIAPVQQVVNT